MTTLTTTIQRADSKGGGHRSTWRLGTALAALGDAIAAWSARQYEDGIGERLETMPPSKRIDAALRWHAGQRRVL